MKNKTKLPIGISSFEQIRTEDYLYVDKTKYMYNLIEKGIFYFLSRPRRFGKSLLISTLRAFFEAKRGLFTGLWIDKNSKTEWVEYPVIVFDFNEISYETPEELKASLLFTIEEYAARNGFKLRSPLLKSKFKELILKLKEKYKQNVVILVDEYDKPIIDFLSNGEEGLQTGVKNRDLLRSFYGTLKGADVAPAIKFCLLTGVSKFSNVSIFSELNNLYDLTMQEETCDLLGYTQEELLSNFPNEIKELSQKHNMSDDEIIKKLNNWYNGYRFSDSEVRVYNPFSILQVFRSLSFKNYWFESGSPSFLVNLLIKRNCFFPDLENIEVSEESFSTFEIDDLKPEALLFQTGYLTIKDIRKQLYILSYPNQEVKTSLLKHIFSGYSEIESSTERSKFLLLSDYLAEEKYDDFFEVIKSLFASIPYTLNSKRDEAYFHTIFYLIISASGIDSRTEVLTSRGRIDLVVEFKASVYIMEFKCNQSAGNGIEQIKRNKYYERYLSDKKNIYLAGINFSTDEKNVVEWDIEKLLTVQ